MKTRILTFLILLMVSAPLLAVEQDVVELKKIIQQMLDSGDITEEQALQALLRIDSPVEHQVTDKTIQDIQKSFQDQIETKTEKSIYRTIAGEKN